MHELTLPDSPVEYGRILGAQWQGRLATRIRAATARLAAAGEPHPSEIERRIAGFRDLLGSFRPEWLEELGGIARGAGVSEDDILLLNAVPIPDARASQGNCTSFAMVGDDRTALFKIRDERPHPQVFYAYRDRRGRVIHAGKEIGNLGIAHGIAENGISAGNNTGSRVGDISPEPRFTDCHMLRYLVEEAETVADVEPLLAAAYDAGVVGGASADRGMILLAADGVAAVCAELSGTKFVVRRFEAGAYAFSNHFQTDEARGWVTKEDGENSRTRLSRMQILLADVTWMSVETDARGMARDTANAPDSLCNDDSTTSGMTVSAQLHLQFQHAASRSLICCGHPRNSVFLTVPVGTEDVPAPLVSGDVFDRANALYRARGSGDHLSPVQGRLEGASSSTGSGDYRSILSEFLAEAAWE